MPDAGKGSVIPSPPDTTNLPLPESARYHAESPPKWAGTLKTVAFVVVIQVIALYITRVNAPVTEASGYSYAPAGTSASGSVYNVLILVVFVFASTVAALLLARRRQVKVFMAIVFIGTALAL